MIFPRITAVIFVIFLIGSLSAFCIGVITLNAHPYSYESNVEYVNGKIVAIEANMDFVLETANGQYLYFHCRSLCHASVGHLQRHLREQAPTIIYYIQGTDRSLFVLYID